MATITRFDEHDKREIIEALTDLLERAHEGKIRGFTFIVKTGPYRHRYGFTGDYWRDPYQILGCATRLEYKANQLISSRDAEPETTTMPL